MNVTARPSSLSLGDRALPHRSARRMLRERKQRPLDTLARVGFFTHGVVYLLVGVLATRVAFSHGGATAGPRQAVGHVDRLVGGGPLDTVILVALAVGLFAYAAWRLVQGLFDPEGDASRKKHPVWMRAARAASGVAYGGIAFTAARLAMGSSASTGDRAPEWTARLMSAPFGVALVIAVGLVTLVIAATQAKKAKDASFLKDLDVAWLEPKKRDAIEVLGRAGHAARGLVFAIVGVFFIVAAVRHDPEEARGLGGALATVAQQPWGTALLVVVALGLAAYGVFELARGVVRRGAPL